MYLERIEIQGFKSFADKTGLEFEPGVTAIVGPNGSGKSVVAESIRWAMGEQSFKSLRAKKSEEVIFAGSSKRARSGFAEVNLHLNNEDHRAPVDWTHVIIGRRLYRDGASEYLINGNVVRLTDVSMMLARASFGARTYAVIGQGMIDQIILQSPEERKEFFDEAAGVRQFQIKKEQTENKLLGAENNLHQAEALLGEIEPRLRYLKRQVKKVEERKTLEDELHALEHAYYGTLWKQLEEKYIHECERALAREKTLSGKKAELAKLAEDLARMERQETKSGEFMRLQGDYQKLLNERGALRDQQLELKYKLAILAQSKGAAVTISELEPDLLKFEKSVDDILQALETGDFSRAKELIRELQKLSKRVTEKIKKPEARTSPELDRNLKDIGARLESIEKSVHLLDNQLKNLTGAEERDRAGFFGTQRQFQAKQNEVFAADREFNDVKIELARLETRRDSLTQEMAQELGERKERVILEAKNLTAPVDINAADAQINKIKYQLSMIGGIDEEVAKEYKETSERYEFLSSQVEDIKKSILSLREAVENLEETINSQFDAAFAKINNDFGKFFRTLFDGGEAKLIKRKVEKEEKTKDGELGGEGKGGREEHKESFLPEAENLVIDIKASPPGKRITSLQMLSGGEKALTSIALICAILNNNPSPFVVLDEVDAALDESNAIRFAKILAGLSGRTQFIVITHNRYTMENARALYGVTMGEDNASRILSVKLEEAVKI